MYNLEILHLILTCGITLESLNWLFLCVNTEQIKVVQCLQCVLFLTYALTTRSNISASHSLACTCEKLRSGRFLFTSVS